MDSTIQRYKYVPFSDGSLSIISNGTMKFTSPTEFNDPFDCMPDIDASKFVEHVSGRKDLILKAGNSLGYSPGERVQNNGKMLKRVENNVADESFIKTISGSVGVCSLSRDPLNLLMWAHYARNHTGFVVEFDIPTQATCTDSEAIEFMLNYLFPLEVKYFDEKPILDSFDNIHLNVEKQFLVKGRDWEYEKEERVVDHYRGPGIHAYDRKIILKSVIAGMRMDDDNYNSLKTIIDAVNGENGTNIHLYKAEPKKGEYGLCVPGREDLNNRQ